MSRSTLRFVVSAGGALALAALMASCTSKEAAEPPAGPAGTSSAISKEASVVDLMRDVIAPTADALWGAVGSESTTEGTRDLAPSTDAQWAELRGHAQTLVDVSKAIMEPDRAVAHPGQKLKDPPGEGDLSPEQAQAAIASTREVYVAFATVMQGVGGDYLSAIDRKDVEAITDIGGKLDEVCEACHTQYWYPKAAKPPAP